MSSIPASSHTPPRTVADALQTAAIVALVLGAGVVIGILWLSASLRVFAVAAGAVVLVAGAVVSGNPRLYFLWGLMLTVPLNLSKRFGPDFIGKSGGEDSFRMETSDIFLAGLILILLWDMVTGRQRGVRVPKVTYVWVALIAIGCAWVAIGPWRTTAAHEVVRMAKVITLFVVLTNVLDRPSRIRHSAIALAISAIGQALIGLAQYAMSGLIGLEILGETTSSTIQVLQATSVEGQEVFRPSGLLQHANLLGVYMACLLPLALGMFMVSRRPAAQVFYLIAMALSAPACIVALSRSAWVTAFVAASLVLVFMLFHPALRFRALAAGGVAAVLGIAIFAVFLEPIATRLFDSKADSTVAREIYKADARRMIAGAPWFGHGLNSYGFELPNYATLNMETYGNAPPTVHNIFYLWWAETGIVGMTLFCIVWGSIIWTGLANLRVRNELLFAANAACLGAMIGLIPDGFLSFTLRVNSTLRLFWVLAGIILAVRYLRYRESLTPVEPAPEPVAEEAAPVAGTS